MKIIWEILTFFLIFKIIQGINVLQQNGLGIPPNIQERLPDVPANAFPTKVHASDAEGGNQDYDVKLSIPNCDCQCSGKSFMDGKTGELFGDCQTNDNDGYWWCYIHSSTPCIDARPSNIPRYWISNEACRTPPIGSGYCRKGHQQTWMKHKRWEMDKIIDFVPRRHKKIASADVRPGDVGPGAERPGGERLSAVRPGAERLSAVLPDDIGPGAERLSAVRPGAERLSAERLSAERPGDMILGNVGPGAVLPNDMGPGAERLSAVRPGADKLSAERPGDMILGAERPGAVLPDDMGPGANKRELVLGENTRQEKVVGDCGCQCSGISKLVPDDKGGKERQGKCNTVDHTETYWCYVNKDTTCEDTVYLPNEEPSYQYKSYQACSTPSPGSVQCRGQQVEPINNPISTKTQDNPNIKITNLFHILNINTHQHH